MRKLKSLILIIVLAVFFLGITGFSINKKYKDSSVPVFLVPLITFINTITTPFIATTGTPSFEKQKEDSAMHGINWLISQKDTLPADFFVNFALFYQVVADEDLAHSLLEISREKFSLLPEVETAVNIYDKKYLDWDTGLGPVVYALAQKKCVGNEYSRDVQDIQKLLETHASEIFPEDMRLSTKLIAAYFLKEIGLDRENFYARAVDEIRSQSDTFTQPGILNDPYAKSIHTNYLYALTHIVFAESDYFTYYLDPQKYPQEIAALNSALDTFASLEELSGLETDIASEIIAALKLFRIPPNEKTDLLAQKIMALQNPDGSWGSTNVGDVMVHGTLVSTLALIEFAPEFRPGDAYCPSPD